MTHEGDSNMISNVLKKTAFLPSRLELFFGGSCHIYRNLYLTKTSHFNHFLVRTGGFWSVNSPIRLGPFGTRGMVWAGTLNLLTEALQASRQPAFPADHPPRKRFGWFSEPELRSVFLLLSSKNTMEHAGIKTPKEVVDMTTWCFLSKGGESKCGGWWTFI